MSAKVVDLGVQPGRGLSSRLRHSHGCPAQRGGRASNPKIISSARKQQKPLACPKVPAPAALVVELHSESYFLKIDVLCNTTVLQLSADSLGRKSHRRHTK